MARLQTRQLEPIMNKWIAQPYTNKYEYTPDNLDWIDTTPIVPKEQPPTPKSKPAKRKWFHNLQTFLDKYNFKVTAIPWRYENDGYVISQVLDEDLYGFAIYSITCKRYFDDSSFRGRLPNSTFAEEVLMAIAEDYTLKNLDNPPTEFPKERNDDFLKNLSYQTDLREGHNIHISIEYSYIDSSTNEYTYSIRYFPKAKEHLKRDNDERIESFQTYGGTYSGAWSTYEEALEAAITKVNTCLIHPQN